MSPIRSTPLRAASLAPEVYRELHQLAESLVRSRRHDSPQPTSLIHEAYLRLSKPARSRFESHSHFVASAARAMRCVLVDEARRRQALKRGGGREVLLVDDSLVVAACEDPELLALDEALEQLAELDSFKSQIIELRHFGGLSVEETAAVLDVSSPTVKRHWALAKAWLFREIRK